MSDEQPISAIEEERRAIDLIARSPEGLLLHRYLRRILESCRVVDDVGALQRHEGARILARDLMAVMAEGIEATNGRPGTAQRDKPLVSGGSKPVATGRTRQSFREFLVANEPGDAGNADDSRSAGEPAGRGRASRLRPG